MINIQKHLMTQVFITFATLFLYYNQTYNTKIMQKRSFLTIVIFLLGMFLVGGMLRRILCQDLLRTRNLAIL